MLPNGLKHVMTRHAAVHRTSLDLSAQPAVVRGTEISCGHPEWGWLICMIVWKFCILMLNQKRSCAHTCTQPTVYCSKFSRRRKWCPIPIFLTDFNRVTVKSKCSNYNCIFKVVATSLSGNIFHWKPTDESLSRSDPYRHVSKQLHQWGAHVRGGTENKPKWLRVYGWINMRSNTKTFIISRRKPAS